MDCRVCRLCGCQKRNLKPIFDVPQEKNSHKHDRADTLDLADLIHKCIGLDVKENEDLPQNVCKMCLNTLTSWHAFYERSKIIQHKFENIIREKKLCISPSTSHHVNALPESQETKAVSSVEIFNDTSTMERIPDSPTNQLDVKKKHEVGVPPLVSRKSKAYSYIKKKRILKATTKEESNNSNAKDNSLQQPSQAVSIENPVVSSFDNLQITVAKSLKNTKDSDDKTLANIKNVCSSLNTTKIKKNVGIPKKMRCMGLPVRTTNASPLHLQCRFCEKVYPSKRTYNRHISMHTDLKEFRCATCLKVYRSKQSLQTHLETHLESRNYVCHVCGQSYQTASTLCNHIQRQHQADPVTVRPFSCSTCGKQFRLSHHLEQHMRMHTGIKPFSCTECPRQFGCASYLRRHIEALHLNTKRHVCATCGKQYLHTTHFKAHLLRHSGLRAFKCGTCDKAFVTRNELMKHERVHSRLKPFQCPLCDKAFSDWSNRKRHISTHEGPLPKPRKEKPVYASLQTFYQSSESFVNIEYVNLALLSTPPEGKCHQDGELDSETSKDNDILFLSDPHFSNEIVLSSAERGGPAATPDKGDNSFKSSVANVNGLEVFLENGNIEAAAAMNESFFQSFECSMENFKESRISSSKESIVQMLNDQGTIVLATSGT